VMVEGARGPEPGALTTSIVRDFDFRRTGTRTSSEFAPRSSRFFVRVKLGRRRGGLTRKARIFSGGVGPQILSALQT
jgi:hypothetical protein